MTINNTRHCDIQAHFHENYLGNCGDECWLEEIFNARNEEERKAILVQYGERNRANK